ncbi:MAG TPA: BON domain-containing protein, partial [Vicinamibacterales bacterium]|nr:BON domain-containing protein [Vicinamibacterales bacterium]
MHPRVDVMAASRAVAIVISALLAAGCGVARAVVLDAAHDSRLTGEVWKTLREKSPDTVTRVDVDVVESTVYLTGRVDTEGEKVFAEAAAWRVEGVR